MKFKIILLATASISLIAAPAFAQEALDAPAEEDAGSLEEIVVTAQKRQERLQDVPVSVTALSSEQIVNQRIVDFSDLTRAAPSLTITQTTSSPNNSIILRGIGTFALSIGVEPSVAVIIDDLPVVQQAQAFDNLADLERIEVLKGPQGTLFGKSASAGIVNIVTKDPDDELSGGLIGTVATDRDVRVEGLISIPLGENVGVRLTGFYRNYPGNVRNLTTNSRLNDQRNYGFRAKFKADLLDTLSFTLIGAYAKSEQDGTTNTLRGIFGTGTPRVLGQASLPFLPTLIGITPSEGNFRSRVDSLGATRNETASIAGKFDLDLGFANLVSITAYQDWEYNFQNDFDGTDVNVLRVLTGGALNGGVAQSGPFHSTNLTEELRLISSGDSALKYVVGVFYSNANTERSFSRAPIVARAEWQAENNNESLGLFGQVDYTLPSNTTLSAGVRYNREVISVAFDNLIGTTANNCAPGTPACRGSNTDSVVTWKGSISQKFGENILLYGSYARGYKGFAYDIVTGFNPARVNGALNGTAPGLVGTGPVRPEDSDSFELGLKSRFLDNRVQLNVIGYYTNYNDFQAQSAILVGTPPVPQFVLNNVGRLRTTGVEVELSAKATDWLRIDAGATYTDAIIRSFPNAQGFPGQTGQVFANGVSSLVGNCTSAAAATAAAPRTTCAFQDRSGARLPNAPKFKWNIGGTAEFGLVGDAIGRFIVNYQRQSSVNFDLLGNPFLNQNGYGILNSSFTVEFGNVRATAFVNNLLNENYASSLTDGFGLLGGNAANDTHPIYQFFTRDAQRYGGLGVALSF